MIELILRMSRVQLCKCVALLLCLISVLRAELPPLRFHFNFENDVGITAVNSASDDVYGNGTYYGNAEVTDADAKYGQKSVLFGAVAQGNSHADKLAFDLFFKYDTFFISMWIMPLKLVRGTSKLLRRALNDDSTNLDLELSIRCDANTPISGYTSGVASSCSPMFQLRYCQHSCNSGSVDTWSPQYAGFVVNQWNFVGIGHNGTHATYASSATNVLTDQMYKSFTARYDKKFSVGNDSPSPAAEYPDDGFYGYIDELKIFKGDLQQTFIPEEMVAVALIAPPTPMPTSYPSVSPTFRPTFAPSTRPTEVPTASPHRVPTLAPTTLSSSATDTTTPPNLSDWAFSTTASDSSTATTTTLIEKIAGLDRMSFFVLVGIVGAFVCIILCVACVACAFVARRRKSQRGARRKGDALPMGPMRSSAYVDTRTSRQGGVPGGARRTSSGRRDRRFTRTSSRHTNTSSQSQRRSRRSTHADEDRMHGIQSQYAWIPGGARRSSNKARDGAGATPIVYEALGHMQARGSLLASPTSGGGITYEQLPGTGTQLSYESLPPNPATTQLSRKVPIYTPLAHVDATDWSGGLFTSVSSLTSE